MSRDVKPKDFARAPESGSARSESSDVLAGFGINAGLVEEIRRRYEVDPSSVHASWAEFFAEAAGAAPRAAPARASARRPAPGTTSAASAEPAAVSAASDVPHEIDAHVAQVAGETRKGLEGDDEQGCSHGIANLHATE